MDGGGADCPYRSHRGVDTVSPANRVTATNSGAKAELEFKIEKIRAELQRDIEKVRADILKWMVGAMAVFARRRPPPDQPPGRPEKKYKNIVAISPVWATHPASIHLDRSTLAFSMSR